MKWGIGTGWVAIAGPLVGGVGSAILFWFGVQNNNNWIMAAGNTGFFLNLFQLVPAKPFDGGFVIQAISKWLLIPGVAILIVLTVLFKSPLLFLIAIISVVSLFGEFTRQRVQGRQYDKTDAGRTLAYIVEKPKEGAFDQPGQQAHSPFPDQASSIQTAAAVPGPITNTLPSSLLTPMLPASPGQRLLIAIAYIGLASCLAWLYRLSSDELTVFLPHHP